MRIPLFRPLRQQFQHPSGRPASRKDQKNARQVEFVRGGAAFNQVVSNQRQRRLIPACELTNDCHARLLIP